MSKKTPVLLLLSFALSAGAVQADTFVPRGKTMLLGHPEARGMLREGDARVVTGVTPSGTSWIAVEKLEGGVPAWQQWVWDLQWSGASVSVAHLHKIQLTSFQGAVISFAGLYDNRDWLKCTIDTRPQPWTTRCTGNDTGGSGPTPPPPPPPGPPGPPPTPRPSWASQPHVIKACGDAFEGQTNELACLDLMTRYRYDPAPVIVACDDAMEGDTNEMACVRAAADGSVDPSAAVAACDAAMEGDTNELACISQVVPFRFHARPAIEACDVAMEGDTNELACITVAQAARSDPSPTIRQCDDSMSGDDAELGCVRRALGVR